MVSRDETHSSQVIHNSATIRIERGDEEGQPIIKKILLDIRGLAYLYNEFNILTKVLSDCGAARGAIWKGRGVDGKLVTYLEWVEGCSLAEWLQRHPPPTSYMIASDDLEDRVNIAKAIAHAVSQIHEQGVVHHDLTPENIMVDFERGAGSCQVKIIDFAHAKEMKNNAAKSGGDSEEIRGDIFALGNVFKDLFLNDSDRNAPDSIMNLIADLLQVSDAAYTSLKDTDDDLEQMVDLPEMFVFERSEEEMSKSLKFLPGKLYGRGKEREVIVDAYRRIANRPPNSDDSPEVVFVSGHSGTGKTSLVEQLSGEVKSNGGHFITGKFDQLRRAQPYTALINAFKDLCDSILEMGPAMVVKVSLAIKQAVGEQGRVLTDVIPRLTHLIGEQPEVVDANGIEAQNRLMFLLRMFLRSVSKASSLVVMSMDDLQWADGASLDLIRMLVTDSENDSFVFIGIARDNELSDTHPFVLTCQEIQKQNDNITKIKMGNLALRDANRFVCDEMGMQMRFMRPLVNVVYEKTNGNVYFMIQILLYLQDEQVLVFDRENFIWEWDENKIGPKLNSITNVTNLVATRIMKCPTEIRTILSVAAAIGSSFDEFTIMLAIKDGDSVVLPVENSEVSSYSIKKIRTLIHTAVMEGFINTTKVKKQYKFLHDSIQEASYSLLSLEEARSLHLQIGSLTFQNSTDKEFEKMLFFAVDHLNKGSLGIQSEETKTHLSKLNLRAAQKAIKSSAYGPATEYLRTGIRLLCDGDWEDNSDGHWENEYKLSLELFTSLVECLYCIGSLDQIEKHVNEIFRHARCFADKQRAHRCLIKCLTAMGKLEEAIDVGFEGLAQLGENFPSSVSTRVILIDLIKTKFMLAGKSNEKLSSLPPTKNEDKLAAMQILSAIIPPMFFCRPKYMPLLVFRCVRLSLKFGLCNESANAFAAYGVILGTGLGKYKSGYRFGQLALTLAEKHETSECIAYVNYVVYATINPWVMHLKETIDPLKYSHLAGMEAGTVEFACICSTSVCVRSFMNGDALNAVERDMHFAIQEMAEYSIESPRSVLASYHQSVLNLMGRSENPVELSGEVMEQEIQTALMKKQSNKFGEENIYVNALWMSYLFGDYNRAGGFAAKLSEGFPDGPQIQELIKSFFCGLTWLALAKETKNKTLKKLAMKQMNKFKKWSKDSPFNCLQKLFLLKAEYAVLQRRYSKAERYYYEAIRLSRKHGFLNDEALAHERFGIFYSERQNINGAHEHLTCAEELYGKWGAHAKVNHVRSEIRAITAS